jgi:hypothetical protein
VTGLCRRWATEIYYHTASEQQQLSLYNLLYSSVFGGPSTFDQVLEREANRVVGQAMLTLRHDPHMLHQVRCSRAFEAANSRSLVGTLLSW